MQWSKSFFILKIDFDIFKAKEKVHSVLASIECCPVKWSPTFEILLTEANALDLKKDEGHRLSG
jgi:hypothetical protein